MKMESGKKAALFDFWENIIWIFFEVIRKDAWKIKMSNKVMHGLVKESLALDGFFYQSILYLRGQQMPSRLLYFGWTLANLSRGIIHLAN
jgi:hypothetical protein